MSSINELLILNSHSSYKIYNVFVSNMSKVKASFHFAITRKRTLE